MTTTNKKRKLIKMTKGPCAGCGNVDYLKHGHCQECLDEEAERRNEGTYWGG